MISFADQIAKAFIRSDPVIPSKSSFLKRVRVWQDQRASDLDVIDDNF